ncbi:MAG: hypothetical protein WD851_16400 [Pirellulales bacterium]
MSLPRKWGELKTSDYQESQLWLQYLDRFWKLLGWDIANDAQLPLLDVEVVIEPSMDSVDSGGIRSRKPDYLFRISNFSRFIAEAKKPAVDIDADKKAIFQAKSYAWNATIPFAVLTDFEQFLLYDTTPGATAGSPSSAKWVPGFHYWTSFLNRPWRASSATLRAFPFFQLRD